METIPSPEREPLSFVRATTSPEDVAAFIEIEKTADDTHTYSAVTTENGALEDIGRATVYFIKRGEEVAGSVGYEMESPESAYIDGLITKPEFRGQGIGRAAMEKVLEELKHVPHIHLVTHPENKPAIELYESLGFVRGEVKENHFGDNEPRMVMTLDRS